MGLIPLGEFYSSNPPRYPRKYMKLWDIPRQGITPEPHCADSIRTLLRHYRCSKDQSQDVLHRQLRRILMWGNNSPRWDGKFCRKCAQKRKWYPTLREFLNELPKMKDLCQITRQLKTSAPPMFGQVSFGSKLLMFLHPDRFPVLDSNIVELLSQRATFPPSAIPNRSERDRVNSHLEPSFLAARSFRGKNPQTFSWTKQNCHLYCTWVEACRAIKLHGRASSWKVSDIERLYFSCAEP